MQEHDVDVAKRIELAAPVTAERDHRQRSRGNSAPDRRADRRLENMLQKHVDQFDPQPADFPAAASVLMAQPEPVLFDL